MDEKISINYSSDDSSQEALDDHMNFGENKVFSTHTFVSYVGQPHDIPFEAGMLILKFALDPLREKLARQNNNQKV